MSGTNLPLPGLPRDDDQWERLASDLLGVSFQPVSDDELPEWEPPPPPPVEHQPALAPASEIIVTEESSTTVEAVVMASESEGSIGAPTQTSERKSADDYWDALEDWNWEEVEVPTPGDGDKSPGTEPRGRAEHDRPPTKRGERVAKRREPSRSDQSTATQRPNPAAYVVPPPDDDDDFAAGLFDELPQPAEIQPEIGALSDHDSAATDAEPGETLETTVEGAESISADPGVTSEASAPSGGASPRPGRRGRRGRMRGPRSRHHEGHARGPSEATRGSRRPERFRRERPSHEELPHDDVPPETTQDVLLEAREVFQAEVVQRHAGYDHVPTWEEAVSYLLKPRGEPRDRRPAHRRGGSVGGSTSPTPEN
ncbi:MAG: hypothetical protein KatS3mg114_0260 [Planctomycetaceae bacterium]|nr:MAG: hypothetical protein KatS3mg114_0260 [Planctomycetaceae bacterium]